MSDIFRPYADKSKYVGIKVTGSIFAAIAAFQTCVSTANKFVPSVASLGLKPVNPVKGIEVATPAAVTFVIDPSSFAVNINGLNAIMSSGFLPFRE
jgi:hypothetical protein